MAALIGVGVFTGGDASAKNNACRTAFWRGAVVLGANVTPPTTIVATVSFKDCGTQWLVQGVGTGFDPAQTYLSLVYDAASVATGPTACLPSGDPTVTALTWPQMLVGSWQPVGGTTRTLTASRVGTAYFPLSQVGTTSIRELDPVMPPATTVTLKACGLLPAIPPST